jgi:ADP-ribosylglycohydrolase
MNGFYIGDIIGNSYTHENEKYNLKTKDFELFTNRSKFSDDTILSFATIDWLLNTNHTCQEMLNLIKNYYKQFPDKEPTIYGSAFASWAKEGCKTFREGYGNGGAMRSSVIGWYASSIKEVKNLVLKAIKPTHNTTSGQMGAEIVAVCVYLLKTSKSKEELKKYISTTYDMDLDENINTYRDKYTYTSDAKETIRPALISFLNSINFEDSIRNAVSFGGDTDTITTINSAISEAYYKQIDKDIVDKAYSYLPETFKQLLKKFNNYLKINNKMNLQ